MDEFRRKTEEIVSQMTLEQKIAQLECMFMGKMIPKEVLSHFANGFGGIAVMLGTDNSERNLEEAIAEQQVIMERTDGIPALRHAEALTGLLAADATVFPAAIGLAATWDPEVVYQMADIIRKQMVSVGIRHALSPVMDIARDPRWGRVGETYGEDPTLCAAMSVAFTKGIQGDELTEGVVATGKHFLGYGMSQGGLNMAANPISPRELREVYAKPFQAAITEANLWGMMNSYGTIDSEMVIDSKAILQDLLRDEMGFEGIVVSDYMSINRMLDLNVTDSASDGGARALNAGLDMELPTPFGYTEALKKEIETGKVSMEKLDEAVRRILITKFKLGLFDDPIGKEEWREIAYSDESAVKKSLEAAKKSIVLLKNNGILPLSDNLRKIAVIGPHADNVRNLFGCYTFAAQLDRDMSGSMADMPGMSQAAANRNENINQMPYMEGCTVRATSPVVEKALEEIYGDRTPTILKAIRERWPKAEICYEKGCEVAGTSRQSFEAAVAIAQKAEVVILTVGGKYGWGTNCTTGEGIDCDKVGLPGVQEELLKKLCETGTPVVLVHMDAKPLVSAYAEKHCAAILENWYPGETGGSALAAVLSGDYNPGGKLPITAIRNEGQIPVYHSMQNGSGYYDEKGMVISKYVEGTKMPQYFFGEGLSYTSFEYRNLKLDKKVRADGILHVSCEVINTGKYDGEEVVQFYVTDELAEMVRPAQELAGFYRVALRAGETKTVNFEMKVGQTAFLNRNMEWMVEAGTMTVKIGTSSREIRLTDTFIIEDTQIIDGKTRGFYAKSWEEDMEKK